MAFRALCTLPSLRRKRKKWIWMRVLRIGTMKDRVQSTIRTIYGSCAPWIEVWVVTRQNRAKVEVIVEKIWRRSR